MQPAEALRRARRFRNGTGATSLSPAESQPQPQPPPARTVTPPTHEQMATVDVVISGFNVWLTRQDVDVLPQRRHRYSTHAEQFLRWQAGGPDLHADRTQARYFLLLGRDGTSEAEISMARTSLSLLRRHLVTAQRAGWTRPGTPKHLGTWS
jgi:hypothetical protein